MDIKNCPECGAQWDERLERCELCGWEPQDPDKPDRKPEAQQIKGGKKGNSTRREAKRSQPGKKGNYCSDCDWLNPEGARFCSKCGGRLDETSKDVSGPGTAGISDGDIRPVQEGIINRSTGKDNSTQVTTLVVVSMLLIVVLYLINYVSNLSPVGDNAPESAPMSNNQALFAPLTADQQRQVETLEEEILQLDGETKLDRLQNLVDLFLGFDRLDLAAEAQQTLAAEVGTPEDWQRAGDLYYDWMEYSQGEQKLALAQVAIAAYERVLEIQPGNLDAKTDLAWTYQYDPAHVMDTIRLTDEVLAEEPDHLKANYNRAVFFMHINRLSQAVEQFKIVKRIAGEGSPFYEQAETIIRAIETQLNAPDSI